MNISLRKTQAEDLDRFFEFQADSRAIHMAAFTSADPHDKQAYLTKYQRFLEDDTIHMQTILVNGEIAGSVSRFLRDGEPEITYGINPELWRKGIASIALQAFLNLETVRPIYACVAFDNFASQKVLERAGFVKTGFDRGFANGRGAEIEEFFYKLEN